MALLQHRDREERPWGSFERFTLNEISTVKIVRVAPGKRISLQHHHKRAEFWRVIAGYGTVTIGDSEHPAKMGDEFDIGIETKHRLAAGEAGITILEIGLGDFEEGDNVRIEDDFGRVA